MQDQSQMRRRKVLQLTGTTAAAAGVTATAGCLGGDDGDDGDDSDGGDDGDGGDSLDEITLTLAQFPDTIDPLDHITGDYFNLLNHIYEPVFDFQPGDGVFSRVAEDWSQAGDGIMEIEIRDDVVFHNGDELTAEDVAWTITRTNDPTIGPVSPIGTFGFGSIGVPTDDPDDDSYDIVAEATGDYTLEVHHQAAFGMAQFELGVYARAMNKSWSVDNYSAEQQGEVVSGASADDFNGTGPYEVVEFTSGEEVVLESFDDYWGEQPPFDRVVFNANGESSGRVAALETGETDITLNIPPEDVATIQNAEGADIRNVTSNRTVFLPMKNTVEPYDSLEFRQAMNYAVDNQEIVDTVLSGFGEARGQPVSPGINGYNPDVQPYEQDMDMAESLVEESGYGGVSIELTAPQGRYLRDAEVAETAADMIDSLPNVNCDVNIVEFPVVSDANSAGVNPDDIEHPFYMIGWGVVTGDTDYGVQGFFTIPDNPSRTFDDEELSEAILESQQIDDPDEREQKLMEVNQLAHEKAPWVFLHTQESIYGANSQIDWTPRTDETIHIWEME